MQGQHGDPELGVRGRIGCREPAGHGVHLRLGLANRNSGRKPGEDAQRPAIAVIAPTRQNQRRPIFSLRLPEGREAETGRHHADNCVRLTAQCEVFSEDAAICAEAALPQAIA